MTSRPHASSLTVRLEAPDDFAVCAVFPDGSRSDVTYGACDLVLLGALHPSPLIDEIDAPAVYDLPALETPVHGEVLFTTDDVRCVLSSASSKSEWRLSFDEFGRMLARGLAVLLEPASA